MNHLFDDGYDIDLKSRIESWIGEENYTFSSFNSPKNYFHFILNNMGKLNITLDLFQEKNTDDLTCGFMTFLSKEIMNKISDYDSIKRNNLKNTIDRFISSIKSDYRLGYRVGMYVISDGGYYGMQSFIKTSAIECTKDRFLKVIDINCKVSKQIDELLNREFF